MDYVLEAPLDKALFLKFDRLMSLKGGMDITPAMIYEFWGLMSPIAQQVAIEMAIRQGKNHPDFVDMLQATGVVSVQIPNPWLLNWRLKLA
jgi:hypothetical protein